MDADLSLRRVVIAVLSATVAYWIYTNFDTRSMEYCLPRLLVVIAVVSLTGYFPQPCVPAKGKAALITNCQSGRAPLWYLAIQVKRKVVI